MFCMLRYLYTAAPANCFRSMSREGTAANIAANLPAKIIGGETGEGHESGFHAADASAEGVLLAYGSSNDGLKIHLHIFEEMLWQVAAMKANCLVWITAVIVVPVEERTWRPGGQLQGVHAEHTTHVHFAGAGKK